MNSVIKWLAVAWCALSVCIVITASAHCEVPGRHHNSLGTVTYTENPYAYIMGNALAGDVSDDGDFTNIRIQPLYTYQLFDESVTLCGDVSDMLAGTHQPMVLVYEKKSHRLVQGIACHKFIAVREVKDKPQQEE